VNDKEAQENPPSKSGPPSDLESVPSSKKKRGEKKQELLANTLTKFAIKKKDLERSPQLTTILEQAEGGIPAVLQAMRFSNNPQVEKFLAVYDKSSITDKKVLPLEAFALKAGVDFVQLLGAAIFALQNTFANIVKVIAITNHPNLVRETIANALQPDGFRDRQLMHTALRFLPQAKGATNVFNISGGSHNQDAGPINPEDIQHEDIFPDLLETQKLLTE
jgi:hypothetical protein